MPTRPGVLLRSDRELLPGPPCRVPHRFHELPNRTDRTAGSKVPIPAMQPEGTSPHPHRGMPVRELPAPGEPVPAEPVQVVPEQAEREPVGRRAPEERGAQVPEPQELVEPAQGPAAREAQQEECK